MNNFKVNKDIPMPLYYQLQQTIIEKINSGIFEENEIFPTEQVIIKESGLSRTTVRQAIDNLVNEGYLEKRRGVGTFVTSRKRNYWDLEKLRSFREEVEMRGSVSSTKLLFIEKIDSNEKLGKIFGEDIKKFYKLERLRYRDETPVILVTTYVPMNYAEGLEKYDLSNNSLFDILKKDYGVKIGYAEKEFRSNIVDKNDANYLDIGEGAPIQKVDTITYDEKGIPIEYSISRDRGDISVYKVRLNYKSE